MQYKPLYFLIHFLRNLLPLLDTVQIQSSTSDDPVLKQTIRYVSNDLLTRERLISAQKEQLTYAL
jgi:hypothetical protein